MLSARGHLVIKTLDLGVNQILRHPENFLGLSDAEPEYGE